MKILLAIIIFCFPASAANEVVECFKRCYEKQAAPLEKAYFSFSYKDTGRSYYHSFYPWQEDTTMSYGALSAGLGNFSQRDSIMWHGRIYETKTQITKNEILMYQPNDTVPFGDAEREFHEQIYESARYGPAYLLSYIHLYKRGYNREVAGEYTTLEAYIHKSFVKIYMRNSDDLVEKITLLDNNEWHGFHGDVRTVFNYADYTVEDGLWFPRSITVDKINEKLRDKISLDLIDKNDRPMFGFSDSLLWVPESRKEVKVETEKYGANIHFVNLRHDDFKSMVVEFEDFLLVAEAPLNSRNGELLLAEAKRIAPGKPVRYFVASHFHNWYTGGIRPFIHEGATVLSIEENRPYLQYIAGAVHTLQPDQLQKDPKPLKLEPIKDSMAISDGRHEMKIYFIGGKSGHTYDYLVYYFPAEKMLFEGDLLGISKEGPVRKAGKREKGFYQAVKDLGLDVGTIVQAWPEGDEYGLKSFIPFGDLEKSVRME